MKIHVNFWWMLTVVVGVALMAGCAAQSAANRSVNDKVAKSVLGVPEPMGRKQYTSENAGKYGTWVGEGPRIVDESGKPLPQAKVHFRGDPAGVFARLDEDGRMIVNRYLGDGGSRVDVVCDGYRPVNEAWLLCNGKPIEEIRMSKISAQPAAVAYSTSMIYDGRNGKGYCSFDLVKRDWLPPYGWGEVEDLRISVTTNANEHGFFRMGFSGSLVPERQYETTRMAKLEMVRDGDGIGTAFADCDSCTTRVMRVRVPSISPNLRFRARGYYGSIDNLNFMQGYGGKNMPKIELNGLVNPAPGLRTLEPFGSVGIVPRPPVNHPAPKGKLMAFGLSEDERSAAFLGWTHEGVKVPEIFRKGIYTANPSRDLPKLETLYIDNARDSFESMSELNGCKDLRTVVLVNYYCNRMLGERAFADNPKLNALVFGYQNSSFVVAENTFEGCATNMTAVLCEGGMGKSGWEEVATSNVFSRITKVNCSQDHGFQFGPEIDLRRGTVDLPRIELREGVLERRFADGRIQRFNRDGTIDKDRE